MWSKVSGRRRELAAGWLLLVTGSASDIIYHPPVPPAVSCDVTTGHKSQNVTNVVTLTYNWSHTEVTPTPDPGTGTRSRAWIGWNKAVNPPSLDSQIFMVRLSEIIILNKVFCRSFTTSLHSTLHTDGYRTIKAR